MTPVSLHANSPSGRSRQHGIRARRFFTILAGAALMGALAAHPVRAAEGPAKAAPERELIPGAERMTAAERDEYRRRMEMAATPEEKARIHAEYEKAAGAKSMPEQGKASGRPVGDPVRGATLHRACFFCHGVERYVAPATHATATFIDSVLRASGLSDLPPKEPARFKGRITSIDQLRAGVTRRNEFLNPKMTAQEIEDVVAYLNATYYKFPAK